MGHYRKVEKNRLNPMCISCSFFCSRTSHCCSNFFLRNSLAISLLLFDTPVRMIFARFFPKRMKDVRFAAVVPYNFSSFRGFGSYIKTRKKRRIGKEAQAFLRVRKAHISYLTNVNVRYIKGKEKIQETLEMKKYRQIYTQK